MDKRKPLILAGVIFLCLILFPFGLVEAKNEEWIIKSAYMDESNCGAGKFTLSIESKSRPTRLNIDCLSQSDLDEIMTELGNVKEPKDLAEKTFSSDSHSRVLRGIVQTINESRGMGEGTSHQGRKKKSKKQRVENK